MVEISDVNKPGTTMTTWPLPMFSFTGNKGSFLGDLNFYGKGGVTFLTQPKTITSYWRTSDVEKVLKPSTSMPIQH